MSSSQQPQAQQLVNALAQAIAGCYRARRVVTDIPFVSEWNSVQVYRLKDELENICTALEKQVEVARAIKW
jgi:hypothetical protein